MASTRNKNTPGNYCLEERQYSESRQYTLYEHSAYGSAVDTRLPGNGLNPGQFPNNQLSSNSTDIESFLLGVNSTNLVKPQGPLTPQLNCLKTANIFETRPVYMPNPVIVEKNQRPFVVPQ
jgi:hypothetical protein